MRLYKQNSNSVKCSTRYIVKYRIIQAYMKSLEINMPLVER